MPIVTKTLDLDLDDEARALLEAGHGPTMLAAMARIAVNDLADEWDAETALAAKIADTIIGAIAYRKACEAAQGEWAEIARRVEALLPPGEREAP